MTFLPIILSLVSKTPSKQERKMQLVNTDQLRENLLSSPHVLVQVAEALGMDISSLSTNQAIVEAIMSASEPSDILNAHRKACADFQRTQRLPG